MREFTPEAEVAELARRAREAGFVVLDLSEVYEDQEEASLILGGGDNHPNAAGHRLIADRLYEALHEEGAIPSRGP